MGGSIFDRIRVDLIEFPKVPVGSKPDTLDTDTMDPIVVRFFQGPAVIRWKVFVEEQKVNPHAEIDEQDSQSIHVFVSGLDGSLIGTARVFRYKDEICKLGRMAVLKEYRGMGYGRVILDVAERAARDKLNCKILVVHAQQDKESFYQKASFVVDETAGVWDEEGMPHVKMIKHL